MLSTAIHVDRQSTSISICFCLSKPTGIGWGMVAISAMTCIYYNVIIMYAIYYMFVSFVTLDGEVPWIDCDNPWNTKQCRQDPYPSFNSMTNDTEKIYQLSSKYSLLTVESISVTSVYFITKTSPYNEHPLTSHFYIVKLGFTGVYFFLIFAQNIDCGYTLEPPHFFI